MILVEQVVSANLIATAHVLCLNTAHVVCLNTSHTSHGCQQSTCLVFQHSTRPVSTPKVGKSLATHTHTRTPKQACRNTGGVEGGGERAVLAQDYRSSPDLEGPHRVL